MGKTFAGSAVLVLLLTSCAQEIPANDEDLTAAGFWKRNIASDLPLGSTPERVESYLRSHGALDISLSEDRRTLRAAQPTKIKRLWPPFDLNSVQIQCSFDSSSGLDGCSVYSSSKSCCGQ